MSWKEIAGYALETSRLRGASYADVRVVDDRQRMLLTKSGKVGYASDSESMGLGVRVIAEGRWGFAATQELDRESVQTAAAHAVSIARASARVKEYDVQLAPEAAVQAEWASPVRIDPFSVSIEQNLALLMQVDAELRATPGVTLAEALLHFRRY